MHQPPHPIRIKTVLKVKVLATQYCPTLYDPLNCNPPGFSVHGILQTRTLAWVTILFSRGSSPPRDQTHISYVWFVLLYGRNQHDFSVTQSCLTLCGPMDCRPPGSVHGILQARILEWVAILLFRGSFQPQGSNLGLLHCRQIFYHLSHQDSPSWLSKPILTLWFSKDCRFLYLKINSNLPFAVAIVFLRNPFLAKLFKLLHICSLQYSSPLIFLNTLKSDSFTYHSVLNPSRVIWSSSETYSQISSWFIS